MKTCGLLCSLFLAFAASTSFAGGLSLRWNQCAGDGGVQNLDFACDTNSGNRTLAAGFTLDADILSVLSDVLVLDVATAGATLAPWWEVRSYLPENFAACRNGAISITAQDGASCPDLFGLAGSMNIAAMQRFLHGPTSLRILCVNAIPVTAPDLIVADQAEYGVARWTISNIRTAGSPSCGGCSLGACFVFNSCLLTTIGNVNNRLIAGPAAPGSDYVTWQGGGGTNCPAATPTRNVTWGSVKSLYR